MVKKGEIRGNSLTGKVKKPWEFSAMDADQRAGPSAAMGDYYGTGFRQPLGKMRSDSVGMIPVPKKKMGEKPASVV